MNTPAFFLAALLAFAPAAASAHTANQPPFVFVSDVASSVYPVTYSSLPDFGLPQDAVNETVVIGQSLRFEIETDNLPILPEELGYLTFEWNFADGSTGTGTALDHAYAKPGPYLVSLTALDSRAPGEPQLLDTVLVNALPDASYKLPSAYFEVNGRHSADVANDVLKAPFARPVTLDASRSSAGSSPIASYHWDLGDQQLASDRKVTHAYNGLLSTVVPVLRVTDSLGLYADATAQVENGTFDPAPDKPASGTGSAKKTAGIAGGLVAAIGIGAALVARRRRASGVAVRLRPRRQKGPGR